MELAMHVATTRCAAGVALLLGMAAGGCWRSSDSPNPPSPGATSLAAGDQVRLLEEVGQFTKVEDSQGQQGYVQSSLLKHRDTSKAAADPFTHTVVRQTPVLAELPTGEPPEVQPRTIAQIDAEQMTLNGLYIGEKSGKEVIAPRNVSHYLVDEATGERCWHAYECIHEGCPGERTAGREHYLFIQPQMYSQNAIHCPACEKARAGRAETPEEWQKWGQYVRSYELPETIRRRAELDQERRAARQRR